MADSIASASPQPALSPFDLDERLAQLRSLLTTGMLDAAAGELQRLMQLAPEAPLVHALEGTLHAMRGRLGEASESYSRALSLDRSLGPVWFDQANVLVALDRREEALHAVEQVLAGGVAFVLPSLRLRVRILIELARYAEALGAVEQALERFEHDAELSAWRGTALRLLRRPAEALAVQEAVLVDHPGFLPSLCERGWTLLALGRDEEALDAFDGVLEKEESFVSALTGIGIAERRLGMREAALAAFDKALSIAPNDVETLFNRALTLHLGRRYDAAIAAYETLIAHRPEMAEAHDNLGDIYRATGALDEAERALRRAIELAPQNARIHSNLLLTLLYQPERTAESLVAEHRAWGERFGRPAGRFDRWANDRDPDRPLRIGFVSAELRRHPVSAWLIPALDGLDRARYCTFCYAATPEKDDVSARIEAMVDGWRDVAALDDAAMAELVRADGIDILIDLSGHTAKNRLTCFALKPAPVQATWLGYPFTTGLDAIDYAIMDEVAVRPGEEGVFVEEVVRLEGGRWCYDPPAQAPTVVQPPVMRQGWITFGSFNNLSKLTPAVIAAWCRILNEVPAARLVVKSPALGAPEVARRYRSAFLAHGLTPGRLEIRGGSPYEQLLAEYGDIDIALDPFPFGGGATSCEALWMGVPVVTLPGWQPVSRQTEAFLRVIDQEGWIARDTDHYVAIAGDLARDPLRLFDWRTGQRERVERSPLCDKARISRELEREMRAMWRRFVATPRT